MKSRIHHLTEQMTEALGPVLRAHPNYADIQQATGLLLARIAQGTPVPGDEALELDVIVAYAKQALPQLLNEEQAYQEKRAKLLAKGLDGFAKMARGVEPVEPGGSADHPDNADVPVAKSPKHFEPSQGLAAINGGLGVAAREEAEEIAGQDHSGEEVSAEEFYSNSGWSNSPIHAEIDQVIEESGGDPQGFERAKEEEARATERDLHDYYNDRCTLEDMEARKARRLANREVVEQARQDTFKEDN